MTTDNFLAALERRSQPITSGEYIAIIAPGSVVPVEKCDESGTVAERGAMCTIVIVAGMYAGKEFAYTFKDMSRFASKAERDSRTIVELARSLGITGGGGSLAGLLNIIGRKMFGAGAPAVALRIVASTGPSGLPDYTITGARLASEMEQPSAQPAPVEPEPAQKTAPPKPKAQPAHKPTIIEDDADSAVDDEEEDEEVEDELDIF